MYHMYTYKCEQLNLPKILNPGKARIWQFMLKKSGNTLILKKSGT